MFRNLKYGLALAFIVCNFTNCANKKQNLVVHPREPTFYDQFVNKNRSISAASTEITSLKLLKIDGLYKGRFAIYDSGRFYYEINNLGNGIGYWHFANGALELKAERNYFNLIFFVSAAEAEGPNTVVQFTDRNGIQKMNIEYKDMKTCDPKSTDCHLDVFEASSKGW